MHDNQIENSPTKKRITPQLIVATITMVLCVFLLLIRIQTGNYLTIDSYDYRNLTDYLRGLLTGQDLSGYEFTLEISPSESTISVVRLFRIAVPLLATAFSFFMTADYAILVLNIIMTITSSVLIYRISFLLGHNEYESIASGLMFSASYFVLSWGLSVLVEASSWFFILIAVLIAVRIYRTGWEPTSMQFGVIGLLLGFGTLVKEVNIAGLLLVLYVLATKIDSPSGNRTSLRNLVLCILGFTIPLLIVQGISYSQFNYTYIDYFVSEIILRSTSSTMGLTDIILNFFWSYWLAFGLSFILAIIILPRLSRSDLRFFLVILLVFTIPNFLIGGMIMYPRFAAHTLPFFFLLAPLPISKISQKVTKNLLFQNILFIVIVGLYFLNVLATKYFLSYGLVELFELVLCVVGTLVALSYVAISLLGLRKENIAPS